MSTVPGPLHSFVRDVSGVFFGMIQPMSRHTEQAAWLRFGPLNVGGSLCCHTSHLLPYPRTLTKPELSLYGSVVSLDSFLSGLMKSSGQPG